MRKVVLLDDHILMAFAGAFLLVETRIHCGLASVGMTADARVLTDKARVQCQSHKLQVEDRVTVEYVTRYVANVQQKYTQRGGARPFGLSMLIAGFDRPGGEPRLYLTDPSGIYASWKATALGRNYKTMTEFLEKHHVDNMSAQEATKLTIRTLLEVVQSGTKNIEVAIVQNDDTIKVCCL